MPLRTRASGQGVPRNPPDPPARHPDRPHRAAVVRQAMGVLLREQKSLRNIPLVFLKGDPEKAARVREVLPDAVYTPGRKCRLPSARRSVRRRGGRCRRATPHPCSPSSVSAKTPAWRCCTLRRRSNCPASDPKAGGRRRCRDDLLPERRGAQSRTARIGGNDAQGQAGVGAVAEEGIGRVRRSDDGADSRDGSAFGLVDYKVCAVDADVVRDDAGKAASKGAGFAQR